MRTEVNYLAINGGNGGRFIIEKADVMEELGIERVA